MNLQVSFSFYRQSKYNSFSQDASRTSSPFKRRILRQTNPFKKKLTERGR
jgi:hypothetical protein